MKKMLTTVSLLLALTNIKLSAQTQMDIWNNTLCDIDVILYAHDGTLTGCGALTSVVFTVPWGTALTLTDQTDIDKFSICSLGIGNGWQSGYCVTATSVTGAGWDGGFVQLVGVPTNFTVGGSTCYSGSGATGTDCASNTVTADWDNLPGNKKRIRIHY